MKRFHVTLSEQIPNFSKVNFLLSVSLILGKQYFFDGFWTIAGNNFFSMIEIIRAWIEDS